MKQYGIIFFLVMILMIPSLVFSSYQSEQDTINDSCTFTAHIEKTWVMFQERPWVTGFVYNCDDGIEYQKKDTVYVRVLDINGNLVDDGWKPEARANPIQLPSKFIFNDSVYRGGGLGGNADTSQIEIINIKENQYLFYMPQIHSIDFEHRGIYQIELSYNNEVRTIWFAVLDPDKWWEDD